VLKGLTPGTQHEDNNPLKNITLTSTSERIFKEIREKEKSEAIKKKKERGRRHQTRHCQAS